MPVSDNGLTRMTLEKAPRPSAPKPCSSAARRFLVDKGFDSKYGARSLKRAIHKYLEDNICDYLMELPADQAKPGVLRAEPNEANDNIKLLIP